MDLNLSNYKLPDLLTLFKLNEDFTKEEFKEAKSIVYAVHPDKSNLDEKFFIFFLDAYKLLLKVAEFKFRKDNNILDLNFDKIKDEYFDISEEKLAKDFTKDDNFNKKFNELFLKHGYKEPDDGYGEWFSSSENLDDSYEKRKQQSRAIAIKNDLTPYSNDYKSSCGILGKSVDNGVSDLKSLYTNDSVIGASEQDLHNMHRCKNLEELKLERGVQLDPVNEMLAEKYMENIEKNDNMETNKRIYDLILEEEINVKNKDKFWANLKQLKN